VGVGREMNHLDAGAAGASVQFRQNSAIVGCAALKSQNRMHAVSQRLLVVKVCSETSGIGFGTFKHPRGRRPMTRGVNRFPGLLMGEGLLAKVPTCVSITPGRIAGRVKSMTWPPRPVQPGRLLP